VNSYPWISATTTGGDDWGSWNAQRTRLGQAIAAKGWTGRIFMISGDAHMLAIDDGTNNQWGGFPVFHFASIDSSSSTKGGPYSKGTSAGQGRFGTVEISDNGGDLTVKGTGWIGTTEWASLTFVVPSVSVLEPVNYGPPRFRVNGVEMQIQSVRLNGQDRTIARLRMNGRDVWVRPDDPADFTADFNTNDFV
jgi:hypothetical protein